MKIGSGVVAKQFTNQSGGGNSQRYKAPKGEHFVMLLLGTVEIQNRQKVSLDERLEAMGWKYVGKKS